MAATSEATLFEGQMDPRDIVDYVSEFGPLLESAEIINTFVLETTTQAAALGFRFVASRPPVLEPGSKNIVFWVEVDDANQNDLIWCDAGLRIPIEITITTSLAPRRYQRTFLIPVKQL